jgi:2-iminobutanoate/2-iminopropanoate deaminase
MPKQIIRSFNLPAPSGPYSPCVKANGFIFVAGQAAIDPKAGKTIGKGVEDQTRTTLERIKTILEVAGASLEDVVKVSVFLKDISDFEKMNNVYKTFFVNEPPARTTVQAILASEDLLVEIDAIAYKP